jgi:hypothetical protein
MAVVDMDGCGMVTVADAAQGECADMSCSEHKRTCNEHSCCDMTDVFFELLLILCCMIRCMS